MERRYHAKNGKIYLISERFDYRMGPRGELSLRCTLSAIEEGQNGAPMLIEVQESEVSELVEERPEMTEEGKKSVLLGVALRRLEQRLDHLH